MDRERLMDGSAPPNGKTQMNTNVSFEGMDFEDSHGKTSPQANLSGAVLPISGSSALSSPWQAIVAIIIQVLVVGLLLLFNQHDIYLTEEGLLNSKTQTLYIVGTTIIATLVTSYTLGQVRRLFVQDLLKRKEATATRRNISVLIGLGSFTDQLHSVGATLNMILIGLITTAIVVGVSPRRTTREGATWGRLSYQRNTSDASNCYTTLKTNASTSIPASWFTWDLPDGTSLGIEGADAAVGGSGLDPSMCETLYVVPSIKAPQYYYEDDYTLGGFPIHASAAGAPYSIADFGLIENFSSDLFDTDNLQWIEQCMPVFAGKKAFNCTSDAQVTTTQDSVTVHSPEGSLPCEISTRKLDFNPNDRSASAIGACTGSRKIGSATVLIGSTNRHADHLWTLMYPGRTPIPDFNGTAGLRCEINLANSVSFQKVLLSRNPIDWQPFGSPGVLRVKAAPGKQACTVSTRSGGKLKVEDVLSNTALVSAAAASWQLLAENISGDGWWPTLYAFAYPRNPDIERVFAKASAIALSLYWGRTDREGGEIAEVKGRLGILAVRVGIEERWGVLLIAPNLWSIGVLVWALIRQRRTLLKRKR